jgi:hypothetical protein
MIGPTVCVVGVPKSEGNSGVGWVWSRAARPGGGVVEKRPVYVDGG